MTEIVKSQAVVSAIRRACQSLLDQSEYLTSLDQMMGDGDMGITLAKISQALFDYTQQTSQEDLGKYLAGAGMAANKAAPSTMGTLLATALMRAGKVVMGKTELTAIDLAEMLEAADQGIQERGKAKPGDKTIIDAIHPASQAFSAAIASGESLSDAAAKGLHAAEIGRDSVTPLRSRIGRASWIGERTEGKLDPGCVAFIVILGAIIG